MVPPSGEIFALPPGCAVGDDDGSLLAQREHPEAAHPYRTPFQRDRARVIHARAFRRLAGKTQVFTHRYSDHFRSRLTHTMEVAQIARAIATALKLNEDMTEALALVHDIGHPPFGHAGERALDEAMQEFGLRFDHNLHALRIVEYFEVRYAAFRGLNLTLGVREGIVKHSRNYSAAEHPELSAYFLDQQPPLEAQLIDLADEIAYLTADMDDGMEAGMLHARDAPRSMCASSMNRCALRSASIPAAAEKPALQRSPEEDAEYPGGRSYPGDSAPGPRRRSGHPGGCPPLAAAAGGVLSADRGAPPRSQATSLRHALQPRGTAAGSARGGNGGTKSVCLLGKRSVAVTGCQPVADCRAKAWPGWSPTISRA